MGTRTHRRELIDRVAPQARWMVDPETPKTYDGMEAKCTKCGCVITRRNTKGAPRRTGMPNKKELLCGHCYLAMKAEWRKRTGRK